MSATNLLRQSGSIYEPLVNFIHFKSSSRLLFSANFDYDDFTEPQVEFLDGLIPPILPCRWCIEGLV